MRWVLGFEVMEVWMVPRVMKEAWAEDDDELGWAGLAGAGLAEGAGCRRNRLHTSGAASQSWGQPALPCRTSRPWNTQAQPGFPQPVQPVLTGCS